MFREANGLSRRVHTPCFVVEAQHTFQFSTEIDTLFVGTQSGADRWSHDGQHRSDVLCLRELDAVEEGPKQAQESGSISFGGDVKLTTQKIELLPEKKRVSYLPPYRRTSPRSISS